MVHKLQLGVSCFIVTGVWGNLYLNYKNYLLLKDKK